MSERRAAFFDLDRTLVRVDTPRLYTRYRRKKGEATWRDSLQVAWWVLQYTAGAIDAPRSRVKRWKGSPARKRRG